MNEVINYAFPKSIGVKFEKAGIKNTEDVFYIVKKNMDDCTQYVVVISSTTGYTARIAERFFDGNVKIIICKQDISDEYSMKKDVLEELEAKYQVVDIPLKYLQSKIGSVGAKVLRKISQGTKVCFELMEYLCEKDMLPKVNKVIVIAGTLKGADTAIIFNRKGLDDYYVEEILCLPHNI